MPHMGWANYLPICYNMSEEPGTYNHPKYTLFYLTRANKPLLFRKCQMEPKCMQLDKDNVTDSKEYACYCFPFDCKNAVLFEQGSGLQC